MKMNRCIIVGGAEIRNYEALREYFRHDDFFIYCDCGLKHERNLEHSPDLIIGDFDSHERPEDSKCEVIVLPVMKDDTDTIYDVKEAMMLMMRMIYSAPAKIHSHGSTGIESIISTLTAQAVLSQVQSLQI